tara:strand:- start:182 stop:361 length:180 start_codon:yes stop_codon:yes gene_type:complete
MKTTEVLISRQEKFQAIRWVNLGVGLLQLYYWVSGASAFVAVIAAVNIGVWSFTRHKKI